MEPYEVVGWTIYAIVCYGVLLALAWFTSELVAFIRMQHRALERARDEAVKEIE